VIVIVMFNLNVLTHVFLMNYFGTELVLCDLNLKRFNLTKGLFIDTFLITVWNDLCQYEHSVWSSNRFHHQ